MSEIDFSIIVCTRNRADQLAETLHSFTGLRIPPAVTWEVIVVDNGSTDPTPDIVESFSDRLPIQCVSQPVPGLSNARNLGIARARGELILWTDDDVLVTPSWAGSYLDVSRRFPETSVFGGTIVPVLMPPTPVWFEQATDLLHELLCARDFGASLEPVPIALTNMPYGANYAVRSVDQRKFLYDPDLGVAPGRRRGGEEHAVVRAILQSGRTGLWVPNALVSHVIPAARQSFAYLEQYYEAAGEAWAHSDLAHRRVNLFGVPPIIWTKAAAALLLNRSSRAPSRRWVRHMIRWARFRGAVRYLRNNTRRSPA